MTIRRRLDNAPRGTGGSLLCRHMVNLTAEQTAKLDAACERLGMARAGVLRKLFREGIDKLKG